MIGVSPDGHHPSMWLFGPGRHHDTEVLGNGAGLILELLRSSVKEGIGVDRVSYPRL